MITGNGKRRVHMPLYPQRRLGVGLIMPYWKPEMADHLEEVEHLLQQLEKTQDTQTRNLISGELAESVVAANLSYWFQQVLVEFHEDMKMGLLMGAIPDDFVFEEVLWYRWKLFLVSRWN